MALKRHSRPVLQARWLHGLLFVALFAAFALQADEASARRYASIVVDASTGEVLHGRHVDRQIYPASLTKMMTLYLVFDALDEGRLNLNTPLKVSRRAAGMPPSKLGLRAGDSIKVKDAILALVTKSANDVAVVVAEALGGSEIEFGKIMTAKARELGMSRTTFRNASGLPNKQQVSTAEDMSKLAQALLRRHADYYHYFSTRQFTYKGRTYPNHNKLLKNYAGTDGIKTGYIHASGFNLVASTVRGGRRLIAVVVGGRTGASRDAHMRELLDGGFASLARRGVPAMASLPPRKPSLGLVANAGSLDGIVAQVAENKVDGEKVAAAETDEPKGVLQPPPAKPTGASKALARMNALADDQGDADLEGNLRLASRGSASWATSPDQIQLDPGRAWGVQVGAFSSSEPAKGAVTRALEKAPRFLQESHVLISESKSTRGAIYRARLLGMSEVDARLACEDLKAKSVNCLVVPPGHS